MTFSAAAESFQKSGSAAFASSPAIAFPRESNPPPSVVNFRLYVPERGAKFGKQHRNLSRLRLPEKAAMGKALGGLPTTSAGI